MKQYHDLIRRILIEGIDRNDRTGVGTRSIFGHQMRFDLSEGFPLVTTKKTHLRSIVVELLWFLRGETNVEFLHNHGVTIWDEWADENGNLGPVYGKQWRSWKHIVATLETPYGKSIEVVNEPVDQIANLVEGLKNNPYSRRHIVTAWNPGEVDDMALPPCHCLFQFYVANNTLSCQLYQRSADVFLGVPFNIASYALLTMMLAQVCRLQVGEFIHTFGDVHLYHNHFEQAELLLTRRPRPLPTMQLNPAVEDIFSFGLDDFKLIDYDPYPAIKAEVAV